MQDEMTITEARKVRRNFRLLAAATVAMIGIGTLVMRALEQLSWIDAIYFSVVSLTTVGYGDIVPKTDLGKLFVCIYLLTGVGIIATFASNLIRGGRARRVINKSQH